MNTPLLPLTQHSRLAGLLVPVFALRRKGDLGIGDTLAVIEAIDFCAENGFTVLQTLPIHETVGDHSPYNPISARALSPALLSLTPEEVPGLSEEILAQSAEESWLAELRADGVKHRSVHPLKNQLLMAAFSKFAVNAQDDLAREFLEFKESNRHWLESYTLFRLLVREYEGNPNWMDWRPEHRNLKMAEDWLAQHPGSDEMGRVREAWRFIQWVAWRQWRKVRQHAEQKNVLLMGELSYGVGKCSADVWAHPELFDLDWSVGTRPLAYFDTNKDSELWGQNWGLPAYRWENHRSDNFRWLRDRVQGEAQFFHVCRVDHLRGYFRAYMFPWDGGASHTQFAKLTEEEARIRTKGRMPRFVPGPDEDPTSAGINELQGRELISVIRTAAPDMTFIAEIMGQMPEYMSRTLEELSLPSLTFPQLERNPDRSLMPVDSFRQLSLITYANHDHAPLAALWVHLTEEAGRDPGGVAALDLENLMNFAGWENAQPLTLSDDLLLQLQRALLNTHCTLAVVLSSDLLGIPQRFNLPGTYGEGTWCERLELSLADYQRHAVYGRRIAAMRQAILECGRKNRQA